MTTDKAIGVSGSDTLHVSEAPSDWTGFPDEQLLDMRFCDLRVPIEGSPLEQRIAQLYAELEARGLRFRPHFCLSDEWFTPDGVPGIAIPFYLAHPRLEKLELAQMLEVEGGDHASVHAHSAARSRPCASTMRYQLRRKPRGAGCSATRNRIRILSCRNPTATVSFTISIIGMRRAIRTKISPKPSRSG